MAPRQESQPNTVGLFRLPRAVRDNIYRKVLVVSHPLFVFQDSKSRPVKAFAPEKPAQWSALLSTCHQLHDETRRVLYGLNHFNFVGTTVEEEIDVIQSYLAAIGPVNAGHLSHACISFPAAEADRSGQPRLREDALRILQLLQTQCTNLETLEAYVHPGNSRGLVQGSSDDLLVHAQDTVTQVDAQLKAISSLSKIIVRFYDGRPAPLVANRMQDLGWVVRIGDR